MIIDNLGQYGKMKFRHEANTRLQLKVAFFKSGTVDSRGRQVQTFL